MMFSTQLKCSQASRASTSRKAQCSSTHASIYPIYASTTASSSCSAPYVAQAPGLRNSCSRTRTPHELRGNTVVVCAAGGDDDNASTSSMGDAATAELKETAAMDELIDVLLAGRTQQELARLVAENVVAIDKKFWLRVATRNDTASTPEEKEKLQVMATAVMLIVDTVAKKTEQQLSDSNRTLQAIVTAASDEKGEWFLPLKKNEVEAVRAALDEHQDKLDEAMLSNAFAWIRKCTEDRFDTMVQLIQKVLQLYAAKQLQTPEKEGVEGAVNQVIYAEEHEWEPLVRKFAQEGLITEPSFMGGLQKRMESTVLGLQSGSYAQRIQAEYLKEVEARAKSVFRELAKSST